MDFPGTRFTHAIKLNDIYQHLTPNGDRYPIVIRVESLAAAFSSYGLDALHPTGTALPREVNAHTIFASISFGSGAWSIKVLKQHLWLNGVAYALPDASLLPKKTLFAPAPVSLPTFQGVERPAPLQPQQQHQHQRQQPIPGGPVLNRGPRTIAPAVPPCTVCRSRPVEVLSSPCFHACMCIPCAIQQKERHNCCPICFQGMDNLVPIRAPQA